MHCSSFCAKQYFSRETMMSRVCSVLCSLLSMVLCRASLDLSQIKVFPKNGISEVFIVHQKEYSFNATTAIDVCTSLGVSIATHAQVKTAQSNGLQTCRYGWVMEKVAVIPRTEKNPVCGKNHVGLIIWHAPPSRLFDVFCFNSTGQAAATSINQIITAVSDGKTYAKTTSLIPSTSFFLSTQLNKNVLGFSPFPQHSSIGFNSSVIPIPFSSTVASVTTSSQTSSPSSSLPSAGYQPSISYSFSSFITSIDSSSYLFTNTSLVTISSNETKEQPISGKGSTFGAVSMACVILVVMVLIMAGTGTVWYLKIKRPHRLSPWERICHRDMFETEMWKHTEQQNVNMQNDSGNFGEDITLQLEDDAISY